MDAPGCVNRCVSVRCASLLAAPGGGLGDAAPGAPAPAPAPVPGISAPTFHLLRWQALWLPGLGGQAQGSPLPRPPHWSPPAALVPRINPAFPSSACSGVTACDVSGTRLPAMSSRGVPGGPTVQPLPEAHLGTRGEGPPQGLEGNLHPTSPVSLCPGRPCGKYILGRGKVRERGGRPACSREQGRTPRGGNGVGQEAGAGLCLQEHARGTGPGTWGSGT